MCGFDEEPGKRTMMKTLFNIGVFVLFSNIVLSGCLTQQLKNQGETIGFIQQLVNDASVGDTVFIPNGVYVENVIVNKSINLVGEQRNATVIIGTGEATVLITADNCTLMGFTMKTSTGLSLDTKGVCVLSNNNVVVNNTIINHTWGVFLESSSKGNIISGNMLLNNSYGIFLLHSSSNSILRNNVESCSRDGLKIVSQSNSNTVDGNNISLCGGSGVYITTSFWNKISGNTFFGNHVGVRICCGAFNNTVSGNVFNGNTHWQAYDSCGNKWDDGETGNFWGDYVGVDKDDDGIGDTPYLVVGGSHDRFPLMKPFG